MRYEMKQRAEENYASAILSMRQGDLVGAREYGSMVIQLYQKVGIQTLQDAAPTRMRIQGVELPDIMHEDVVRKRLGL